jgi:hypothetical protein
MEKRRKWIPIYNLPNDYLAATRPTTDRTRRCLAPLTAATIRVSAGGFLAQPDDPFAAISGRVSVIGVFVGGGPREQEASNNVEQKPFKEF